MAFECVLYTADMMPEFLSPSVLIARLAVLDLEALANKMYHQPDEKKMLRSRFELETSREHLKCETNVITNYTIEAWKRDRIRPCELHRWSLKTK